MNTNEVIEQAKERVKADLALLAANPTASQAWRESVQSEARAIGLLPPSPWTRENTKPLWLVLAQSNDYCKAMLLGAKLVFPSDQSRPEYYHLSDYCVSSSCGPTLWLTPNP